MACVGALIGAVLGAAAGGIGNYLACDHEHRDCTAQIWTGIGIGAGAGALAGLTLGASLLAGVAADAVLGAATSIANGAATAGEDGRGYSGSDALIDGATGAAFGVVCFGVGKGLSAGAKALFKRLARVAELARVAKVWKAANEKPYSGNPDEITCSNAGQDAAAELPAGYLSFRAAKTAMGSPGEGNVFDHVVEQSQIGRSNFLPKEIHHPFNMNPVSAGTNQLKANCYSTRQFFTGSGTVRDWMNGQSFSDQDEFGMDVLRRIENGIPLP